MNKYTLVKYCKIHILLLISSLLCATGGFAQSVIVEARMDSVHILIGEQTNIKLEVSYDAASKLQLPFLRDTLVAGVEVLESSKPDTTYLNEKKRLLVSQSYTVTSFDSALYYIPPFEVMVDDKPYHSNALALKVYSVPVDTLNPDAFFPQKTIMYAPFAWEDWALAIWLSILAIPLLLLLIYLIIRFNDNKTIIKRVKIEPKLPPHIQAMQEMERIKAERVWQKGLSKEYYTELTDVIRNYIYGRFGFNALEMTSSEIIDQLQQQEEPDALKDLKELFMTADLVKFAKHNPLMNENDMNLINAIEFINQTKVDEVVNAKPEPTEITIEEKRSKRSKAILMVCIVLLGVVIAAILAYIGLEVYDNI